MGQDIMQKNGRVDDKDILYAASRDGFSNEMVPSPPGLAWPAQRSHAPPAEYLDSLYSSPLQLLPPSKLARWLAAAPSL